MKTTAEGANPAVQPPTPTKTRPHKTRTAHNRQVSFGPGLISAGGQVRARDQGPKKEALSSLHIASSGLRQIPPIPPRWPQLCIRFSSHQAVFGLLSLGGGKFPRLCHRATCDQHATPQVQDERGASEEQPSDAHQC